MLNDQIKWCSKFQNFHRQYKLASKIYERVCQNGLNFWKNVIFKAKCFLSPIQDLFIPLSSSPCSRATSVLLNNLFWVFLPYTWTWFFKLNVSRLNGTWVYLFISSSLPFFKNERYHNPFSTSPHKNAKTTICGVQHVHRVPSQKKDSLHVLCQ